MGNQKRLMTLDTHDTLPCLFLISVDSFLLIS